MENGLFYAKMAFRKGVAPPSETLSPHTGNCQHVQLQRLTTSSDRLAAVSRNQKNKNVTLLQLGVVIGAPDGVGRFKVQGLNALSRVQGENHPCPSLERRGVQSCLRTTFLCIKKNLWEISDHLFLIIKRSAKSA